jgi:hypothetical protein
MSAAASLKPERKPRARPPLGGSGGCPSDLFDSSCDSTPGLSGPFPLLGGLLGGLPHRFAISRWPCWWASQSRCMRRDTMTPAAVESYTPLICNSLNSLGITLVSTLSARPTCLIVGGLPLTSSRPGGSAWAIRHSMRNHRPCAARLHWFRPGSVNQSSHQNFAQRRRVIRQTSSALSCPSGHLAE